MKNYIILISCIFCNITYSQTVNIPDNNFKEALIKGNSCSIDFQNFRPVDINKDGLIQVSEVQNIVAMNVNGLTIKSMEGINNFTKLKDLNCSNNQITTMSLSNLTALEAVDVRNNYLTNLTFTGTNNIKSLFCQTNFLQKLDVQNLNKIEILHLYDNKLEEIDLKNNKQLANLNFANNQFKKIDLKDLPYLENLTFNNNSLTDVMLSNLPSLRSLNCSFNFIKNLTILNLKNLEKFNCSNNNLKNLDLSNIVSVIDVICRFNNLESINLKNNHEIRNIDFSENPNLKFICVDEIEGAKVAQFAKTFNYPNININSYCSFIPGGKTYNVSGRLTYDINDDNCSSNNSIGFTSKMAIIGNNNFIEYQYQSDNQYSITLNEGEYKIIPQLNNEFYFKSTPLSFATKLPSNKDTVIQNFCISPVNQLSDIALSIIPIDAARPGFNSNYKLVIKNDGNQVESGTLVLFYPQNKQIFISASEPLSGNSFGNVKFEIKNLKPFESRSINFVLKTNPPTSTSPVNVGDILDLSAAIKEFSFTMRQTVVGSFDPNDKTCLEGNKISPDQLGKYVNYLIRFENTGNYLAENVVVKDLIDTNTFEISTLEITSSSHPLNTKISSKNNIEFIFENINLPFADSINDGYIVFKIKTKPTLTVGSELKNIADIYFDYNLPIRTNEARTFVERTVAVKNINSEQIVLYPNPANELIHLRTDMEITKIEIQDVQGRVLISSSNKDIEVASLKSGLYLVRIYAEDGKRLIMQFIK
jgi:uncharacterized repeat protein (TIGR01451 family)